MKHTYSTILFSKKAAVFPLIFMYTFLVSANSAHAGYWGESMAAAMYTQVQEELSKNLRGAITGAFKQAVGQIMNTRISMMIGGGNGQGPMFIANWETFLITDPTREANTYLNDFFSMSTQGRNSSSNYRPVSSSNNSSSSCSYGSRTGTMNGNACILDLPGKAAASLSPAQQSWFAQEGIVATANAATAPSGSNASNANSISSASGSGNYYKDVTDAAKKAITPDMPSLKLMNYVRSPDDVFAGNWRGMGPLIDDKKYPLEAKNLYQNKLAEEQHKADIQAIAYQGFKAATSKDGTVKTPGITISQLVGKVQGFNFDTISSAQDWGQLISSGVSAAATMAINTAVQVGLNAATNAVQSGVDKVTGAVSNATGGLVNVGVSSGSSLANVNWNNSNTGQSTEFNTNAYNANSLSGGQNSYSTLGASNFQSPSQSTIDASSISTFKPDTSWSAPTTIQSNDPTWTPGN